MRGSALTLASVAAAALAIGVGAPPAAEISTPFVVARAPLGKSVRDLLRGRVAEDVMCTRACAVSTSVVIRRSAARRLGITGVTGDWYEIGTASGRLSARVHRKLTLQLKPRAVEAIGKAGAAKLQILGRVEARATAAPAKRGSAAWIVTLA